MGKLNRRKFCECNICGLTVKPGNRYISGHNGRIHPKPIPNHHPCECPCGELVASNRRFINGHSIRPYVIFAKENNIHMGLNKGHEPWNKGLTKETDERVMAQALTQTGYHLTEDHKAKIKSFQNLPETKLAKSKIHKGKIVLPEVREIIATKCRIISLKIWENDEFRKNMSGENSSLWRGGVSFIEYGKGWTSQLRESIRKRDNYQCKLCGVKQNELKYKLHVHHIDYNKKNCGLDNLISLCQSCHTKTNVNLFDRYFTMIMFQHIVKYGINPNIGYLKEDILSIFPESMASKIIIKREYLQKNYHKFIDPQSKSKEYRIGI